MSFQSTQSSSLPPILKTKVSQSRLLVVGAGGIGCELLKNLATSGFPYIEVVDLDTIDVSNLNRQFLFQRQHVKKSKALVAAHAVNKFNPSITVIAHHANIKDEQFNLKYFKSFDLILNALDNLDARRHVNRMGLLADIPIVESGTAGYLGQTTVIQRGVTECFDCLPKETPKTYPVCTIRLTPNLPIHCVVWAKNYLFNQLFGEEDVDTTIDNQATEKNVTGIEELKREAEELSSIKSQLGTSTFTEAVFSKIFLRDIQKLCSFEQVWKGKQKPDPLTYNQFLFAVNDPKLLEGINPSDTTKMEVPQAISLFNSKANHLATRLLALKKNDPTASLTFDKDDNDAMQFVSAAAILRSYIFHIEPKSLFDIKAMAGNIIPAIATTNAIIAGVMVMQAFKVLTNQIKTCKTAYLIYGSNRPKLLMGEHLAPPNPSCATCTQIPNVLSVNRGRFKLTDIINQVLDQVIKQYKTLFPTEAVNFDDLKEDVTITVGHRIVYDIDFPDNLEKTLDQLKVKTGDSLIFTLDENKFQAIKFYISENQLDSFNKIPELPKDIIKPHFAIKRSPEKELGNGIVKKLHYNEEIIDLDELIELN